MKLEAFGQRLRWVRENHAKITQTDLAKKMTEEYGQPVGKNYISELEKGEGKKRPSFDVVQAMASAMRVSLDFFAGYTETIEPAYDKEPAPHYFSEEADEIARLVDKMHPEQRALVLALARNLAPVTQGQQQAASIAAKNLAGWQAATEVLEERFGPEGAEEYLALLDARSPDIAAALRLSATKKVLVKKA